MINNLNIHTKYIHEYFDKIPRDSVFCQKSLLLRFKIQLERNLRNRRWKTVKRISIYIFWYFLYLVITRDIWGKLRPRRRKGAVMPLQPAREVQRSVTNNLINLDSNRVAPHFGWLSNLGLNCGTFGPSCPHVVQRYRLIKTHPKFGGKACNGESSVEVFKLLFHAVSACTSQTATACSC